jgi:hypothetical protein
MERNVLAFCHHQSNKMIEYAEHCDDPVLKDKFLQMSAYWLKASAPNRDAEQSTVKNTSAETRLTAPMHSAGLQRFAP